MTIYRDTHNDISNEIAKLSATVRAEAELAVDALDRSVLGVFAIERESLIMVASVALLREMKKTDRSTTVGSALDLMSMASRRVIRASGRAPHEVYAEASYWGYEDIPSFTDAKIMKDAVAFRVEELSIVAAHDERYHDFFIRGFWDIEKIARYIDAGMDYEISMALGED